MQREPKFYIDNDSKLIVEIVDNPEQIDFVKKCSFLTELVPNTSEGAAEKHLPAFEIDGQHIIVKVGSIFHPMTEEHSIIWICLQTQSGCQRIYLKPDNEPVAHFVLQDGDEPIAAYAYCNLHGFWKTVF